MTSNKNIGGMLYPTTNSYAPGANSPSQSAMLNMQRTNQAQANLNASVGGKRKSKKNKNKKLTHYRSKKYNKFLKRKSGGTRNKGLLPKNRERVDDFIKSINEKIRKKNLIGGNNTINVPQFQMNYTNVGGVSPNQQIQSGAQISTQNYAWSAGDNQASKLN
jgi:hypothetical protein